MKRLIKQRVFSWKEAYDIYDESGKAIYYVESKLFSLGHQIYMYDTITKEEVGAIKEEILTLLPRFGVEVGGRTVGTIQKEFTFFKPKYQIDCNGWYVEGDFLDWDYDVFSGGGAIIHISKELLHWGDTYAIDIHNPSDEIMGLLLVIAIDAANCTNK